MKRILGRFEDGIYSIARFVIGGLFACHGAQKLFGVLGGNVAKQPLMLLAGVIEFAGGVLVAIGLFTGIAAFIASGEMAVAYFMVHAKIGFWPILNKGEAAVFYCFFFLFVAAHGGGKYCADAWRGGSAARRA